MSTNLRRSAALSSRYPDHAGEPSLIEFEVHLEIEPELNLDAESLREIEGGFSRDALLAADDFAHDLFGSVNHLGERSLRQATRVELLSKNVGA